MEIREQDILWLREHYAGLRVQNPTNVASILRFRAAKNQSNAVEVWHKLPPHEMLSAPRFIEDAYEIEISLGHHEFVPTVRETGGRLEKRAHEMGKSIVYMHVFPGAKTLCLETPLSIHYEMRDNPCFRNFLEKFLIPYFYYHSHAEKYGYWPWPDHPHNEAPLFEDIYRYRNSIDIDTISIVWAHLSEKTRTLLTDKRGKIIVGKQCVCGSGRKAKKCHPLAREGFNVLSRKIRSGRFPTPRLRGLKVKTT